MKYCNEDDLDPREVRTIVPVPPPRLTAMLCSILKCPNQFFKAGVVLSGRETCVLIHVMLGPVDNRGSPVFMDNSCSLVTRMNNEA